MGVDEAIALVYIEFKMNAATEIPEFCLATLARPATMHDRTWTGKTWVENAPTTTFVRTGERVWLLNAGPRSMWHCMDLDAARAEWKRLRGLGYERTDKHTVEVVALAELLEDTQRTIDDDRGMGIYREGTVRAGLAPVLRDRSRSSSPWLICLDVVTTVDTTSVRAVGSRSVETKSIYCYELVTALVEDSEHFGWRYYGISESLGAKRLDRPNGGRPLYTAREIAA